jgi:hypothetical protein
MLTARFRSFCGVALLTLATACGIEGGQQAATPTPTERPWPAPTASASPPASPSPDATPQPTPAAEPTASPPEERGGDVFEDPDTCENPEAGYIVSFPDAWWYNTDYEGFAACQFFHPERFEVTPGAPPDVAITFSYAEGEAAFGFGDEQLSYEELTVAGHPAVRIEERGARGGFIPVGQRVLTYLIGIGDGERYDDFGPTLALFVREEHSPDYEAAVEVATQMLLTLEIAGTIDV